jgi:hypothetical protein
MGLFGFGSALSPPTAAFQGIVAQYKRLRPIRLRLNNELMARLPHDAFTAGAKALGMFHRGTLVFDNEQEMALLMDYCIHNVSRRGRNAVEQYLCDSPPDPDSDEMVCLHALQHASHAYLVVLRVEPGVGCHVRNLVTDETRLLVDFGLSKSAVAGAVLAARMLDFGEYVSTSGAVLPLGILRESELGEFQRKLQACRDGDHSDPAPLIRACLERGASARIRYEGPDDPYRLDAGASSPPPRISVEGRGTPSRHRARKALANQRCRCGSGKMVKNCCGKR